VPNPSLIAHFTETLSSAGGTAHHVPTVAEAVARVREIAGEPGTIWASPTLAHRAPELMAGLATTGFFTRIDGEPESVRDQPLGITVARKAIAETGSSLLVEPDLADRSVSLMTHTLIVVCDSADLLERLDEAASELREASLYGASYATLVTGPSRTADIERQLTVGVQGPAVFHVILIDDLA
jgi:L-lactate dehydrogenase complex protein LldG